MSKTRWFFLWLLFIAYLIFGAIIFYSIERDLEEKRRHERRREKIEIQGLLNEHLLLQASAIKNVSERERSVDTVFLKLTEYCGKPILRSGANATEAEPYVWTYYNSFFFALTTLSTIGYGNLSPTSNHGKIWVIIYSLIGIPFNGIVLTHLGDFFGSKFLRAHHRYKNHTYESRITLIIDILIYLIPGMAVFILAPSVIFIYYENWTFIESIYYSFVSLTTIGYGDFVAGQTPSTSPYEIFYKIFLIVWIMFGLGYLVMILGFISRAMRSEKINKLERKVAQTLKHTQSKIWNEFVHDVHYLRRILNEMYLLKVKPVYREKAFTESKSQSCPNLTEWPVLRPKSELGEGLNNNGPTRRRRAFSENEQVPRLQRVLSDGALEGIDRQATFSGALLDTNGFFLPSAFGPGSPEDSDSEEYKDGGINVFSDEEILSSEDYTNSKQSGDGSWFLGGIPIRRRGRAMSDAQYTVGSLGQQKTWAGAESLHQFTLLKAMRAKSSEWPKDEEKGMKNEEAPPKGLRRLSIAAMNFFSPTNKLKKKTDFGVSKDPEGGGRGIGDFIFGKSHPKKRLSLQEEDNNAINDELNYFTQYPDRRRSILDLFANSPGAETPISPVLEQTSIADFLRVVHSLKAMEASRPSSPTPLSTIFPNTVFQGKDPPKVRGKSTSSMGGLQTTKQHQNRRFSHIPNLPRDFPGTRPRAASIAPTFGGISPVDRRIRKVSATARSSPQSSGVATPTRYPPPSLVITSPGGSHMFSIHNVEQRKSDVYKDLNNKS